MPVFITEEHDHPHEYFGRAFRLDLLLPWWIEGAKTVSAYISDQFNTSRISRQLAERLGFVVTNEQAAGEIVLESSDGGCFFHRTPPIPFCFRLTDRLGDAYLHFCLEDLGEHFAIQIWGFTSAQDGERFNVLVLSPLVDPDEFCCVIPERS